MNLQNELSKMFGRVAPGMCSLTLKGKMAVKTSSGYRYYNEKKGSLVNADGLVINVGDAFFFVIPTNKVVKGDIIIADGKPKYVREVKNSNSIEVVNYETGTVENILPERHVILGKRYMYGKIVNLLGSQLADGKGTNNIFKYMMISSLMGGNKSGTSIDADGLLGGLTGSDANSLLPLLMMNGGMGGLGLDSLFGGLFDNSDAEDDEDEKPAKPSKKDEDDDDDEEEDDEDEDEEKEGK